MTSASIEPFYRGWHLANEALVRAIQPLSLEQLQVPVGRADWPIWASVAHLAGARVFWLCSIFGEPGSDATPFSDGGWDDDLAHPRRADELVHALESSWRIVERCLDTWTPDTLTQEARRTRENDVRIHTRQSVIIRLMTHDAFHCGEISLALGTHGIGEQTPNGVLDLWSGLSRVASRDD